MTRPPKYSREQILEAAERVVVRLGAPRMSFDAVAREADVSKGAVLHYFGTREDLVAAMVERLVERLAPRPDDPAHSPDHDDVAALIDRSRDNHGGQDRTAAALLAAVTQNLAALAPIRRANRDYIDWLASSPLGPFGAQLLHFALDGLWMSEVLGISPLNEEERAAFFQDLRDRCLGNGPSISQAAPDGDVPGG